MLLDQFESLLQVENHDELLAAAVGFARRLGFQTVCAMAAIDHVEREPEFVCVDNTPAAYRDVFENPENGRRAIS